MRLQQIGHPSTETRRDSPVRYGRLPLRNLIGMGEKAQWQQRRTGIVCSSVGGLRERSGIGEKGQISRIEQAPDFGQSRVHGEGPSVAACKAQRQHVRPGKRQIRSHRSVGIVATLVIGNQHIEGVRTTGEQDAHQRFVVISRRGSSGASQRTELGSCGQSQESALLQKTSARIVSHHMPPLTA